MQSILDELTWIPPAMGFRGSTPASSMSIAFSTRDSQRNLRVGSPWFIRSLLPQQFGKHWSESCGLLRRKEIPIFCSADMLQKVPAKDLPVRFAVRNNSQPLHVLDLKTADVLELDCRDSQACHWSWPLEVGTLARLPSFVGAVRQAAGGTTPIGLSLPAGAHKADVASCINAQVDFLTLIDDGDSQAGGDGLLIESLASTRALLIKAGQPQLPVLVVTSPQSIEHALKLLAIGATAISLDSLLHKAMTGANYSDAHSNDRLLSSIGASIPPKAELKVAERFLDELAGCLAARLSKLAAGSLAELGTSHLRALTQRASTLARVPLITD